MTQADKNELLYILDSLSQSRRISDSEYCRAIELVIGADYPIDGGPVEYEYNVDYTEGN